MDEKGRIEDSWDPNLHGGRTKEQVESQVETVSELGKLVVIVVLGGLAIYCGYIILLLLGVFDKGP